MILHLIDDEKFIDSAMQHFEYALPSGNSYAILFEKEKPKIIHIKNNNGIVFFNQNKLDDIIGYILKNSIKIIAIHYLSYPKSRICNSLKKKLPWLKMLWFFWGADGYELGKLKANLYQPKTAKLVRELSNKSGLKRITYRVVELFAKKGIFLQDYIGKGKRKIELIKKFDFVVPVIKEDFVLLHSKYPMLGEAIEWNYLNISQMLIEDTYINGDNILLGNSAHASNNHIEMIDLLSTMDLKGRLIIVPLSYGDAKYRDQIIKYGNKLLGNSFKPLVTFLPLDKYNEIIRSCGFVIMNQNRQQAMGNIFSSLYIGAKVFLNEKSTPYLFFKNKGCKVFPINRIFMYSDKELTTSLSIEECSLNKRIIEAIIGVDVIKKKTDKMIRMIIN